MTLPSSGALSMSAINTEFGRGNNLNSYRGTVWYTDAGATGTFTTTNLGFNQFYGKRLTSPSFTFNATISASTLNYNLRNAMISAGYSGSGAFTATVTINSGVWVYSNSQATAAFDTGALSGGTVSLTNNGNIIGCGGDSYSGGTATGGRAINLQIPTTIVNNGYIAGGGGAGGQLSHGGAGAGGGIVNSGIGRAPLGGSGSNGGTVVGFAGGGGGRILPGSGGSAGASVNRQFPASGAVYGNATGGGAGGGGGTMAVRSGTANNNFVSGVGGAGGGAGNAGSNSGTGTFAGAPGPGGGYAGGGGGGWGASGGAGYTRTSTSGASVAGNAGGRAIMLNGNTANRSGSGTTYGAVA